MIVGLSSMCAEATRTLAGLSCSDLNCWVRLQKNHRYMHTFLRVYSIKAGAKAKKNANGRGWGWRQRQQQEGCRDALGSHSTL
jgi:hypothetical protein